MASAVGDDERGHEAIRILKALGIDTSLVETIPEAATGSVGVGTVTFADRRRDDQRDRGTDDQRELDPNDL